MRSVVAILAHQAASLTVRRHWPWYERAGCDLVGVGRTDKLVEWPAEAKSTITIGQDGGALGRNHLDRIMILLRWFLDHEFYDDICIIEYDGIFLRPLPDIPNYISFTPAGAGGDGFAPCQFFHSPWWFNRAGARLVLTCGERMLAMGLWERGFVDRWLGLMVELYRLPWAPAPAFSVNTLDSPAFMAAAREAVRNGAVYVHGVKTPEQLKELTHGFE